MEEYNRMVRNAKPVLCDEPVYEDEALSLRRIWRWRKPYFGSTDRLVGVSLREEIALCTLDGRLIRAGGCRNVMDECDGHFVLEIDAETYIVIDGEGRTLCAPVHGFLGEFCEGRARVIGEAGTYWIDSDGKTVIAPQKEYAQADDFCEGRSAVSTWESDKVHFRGFSDYDGRAGRWGFMDTSGKTVVPPQYLVARRFHNGRSVVCRAEGEYDDQGDFWVRTERWGMIDAYGHEVVPCIYDEITADWVFDGIWLAHYGGWGTGKWGVLDRDGRWVVEPQFDEVEYLYEDGMLVFLDDDDVGVYDLRANKVLLPPEYSHCSFKGNGVIRARRRDAESIEYYDRLGNRLDWRYTDIHAVDDCFIAETDEDGGKAVGLIDHAGNVILEPRFDVQLYRSASPSIEPRYKRVFFTANKKIGMRDFEDNVILAPEYEYIGSLAYPLILVQIPEGGCGLVTHTGKEVLAPRYKGIKFLDDTHILCYTETHCEMLCITEKAGH